MAPERSAKYQVGRGMILAGVFLAVPGALIILLGNASAGFSLLVIPVVLVFVGLHLRMRANQESSST